MQKKKVELRFGCDIGRKGNWWWNRGSDNDHFSVLFFTLMHKANGRCK